jgi:putative N6-adenine-specific DNA methylase
MWLPIRQAAEARRQPPRKLAIYGSDILESQQRKAFVNLRSAGLEGCVEVGRADLLDLQAPAPAGVLVANPPYGVRLSDTTELEAFYPKLGDALKAHWAAGAATSSPATRPCRRASASRPASAPRSSTAPSNAGCSNTR